MKLVELREKYHFDGGNYEPKPDCDFCHGEGERTVLRTGEMTFCICLFVDHGFSTEAGHGLAKVARELRDELESPELVK